MSFWEKIKQWFRQLMSGRNGVDQLSIALVWGGLLIGLIGNLLGGLIGKNAIGALVSMAGLLVSNAAYIFAVYRIFSRNLPKRQREEQEYQALRHRVSIKSTQAVNRFKNRKQYKYFRCPGCKTLMRLPRNKGVVTVTCKCCHNSFTQKS
jgi:predicted lipid-binding transport protein (Tim44 family)